MQALLSDALEHHRSGSLAEAAQCYRTILAGRPEYTDAIHLLGVVAMQQGDPSRAADLIGRAIALEPREALYHGNLAEAYRLLGRPERAIAAARAAIRLKPDYPEAAHVLGLALLARGEDDEAITAFREAIRLRPDFAAAHNNLGNAWLARKDGPQAVAAFRRALEIDPMMAEAHSNLGQLLLERGDAVAAVEHCREAVRLRPLFAQALCNLGNALRALRKLDDARRCYDEALRLAPGLAIVHNNMGQALQEEGRLDEAIARYREALSLEPGSARIHANLASALADQEKVGEAAERFETAIHLDPAYAPAHSGLGAVRVEQGRYDEARACYEQALGIDPDLAGPRCALGGLLLEQGDFEAARHRFREALDREPRHAGALAQSATLLKEKLPENELATMVRLVDDPEAPDGSRSALHFGLAHVLDARGDYAGAAAHLEKGNALASRGWARLGRGYDPSEHDRTVDRLIAACTPAFFDRLRGAGSNSERPVFVFGLPRSGTTLAEQILASHSRVYGAGEIPLGHDSLGALPTVLGLDLPSAECLAHLSAAAAGGLAMRHLDRLAGLGGTADRVVDKLPDNYLHLGLLAVLFPRARFIHCRRDLRDVAVSCWMTNFSKIRWATAPEHIAHRFRQYTRLMDHWRRVLPVPVLDLTYEEVVSDLQGQSRRLLAWCDLEWEPACLAFHETRRPVRTASLAQVRRPIYRSSVDRWRRYEPHLGTRFSSLPIDAEAGGDRPA